MKIKVLTTPAGPSPEMIKLVNSYLGMFSSAKVEDKSWMMKFLRGEIGEPQNEVIGDMESV